MIVFAGLGNPGDKYANTRHNIGFMAVERIAADHGFSPWRAKFQGLISEGRLGAEKVVLLKPQTFMNLSGQSVAEALKFFKLEPPDLTVFHDEIDLAPGKVRLKAGGGHAGHNGLRSIHQHIGPHYDRVRLGVGHGPFDQFLGRRPINAHTALRGVHRLGKAKALIPQPVPEPQRCIPVNGGPASPGVPFGKRIADNMRRRKGGARPRGLRRPRHDRGAGQRIGFKRSGLGRQAERCCAGQHGKIPRGQAATGRSKTRMPSSPPTALATNCPPSALWSGWSW